MAEALTGLLQGSGGSGDLGAAPGMWDRGEGLPFLVLTQKILFPSSTQGMELAALQLVSLASSPGLRGLWGPLRTTADSPLPTSFSLISCFVLENTLAEG